MERLNRGDKIYLDTDKTKESDINRFLACRDGIVEVYEYNDHSGYGSKTRLFLCRDTKHEEVSIIRHVYNELSKEWTEESMHFDSDSFEFLQALVSGDQGSISGKYSLVRDY